MNEQELINYYNKFNEDKRLNTKHAQVEFLTAMKYIKDYLKLKLPKKGSDSEDWVDSQHTTKKIYDNLSFIHDVYLGYDHIDNSMNLDKTNMENLAHSFNEWMAWDIE